MPYKDLEFVNIFVWGLLNNIDFREMEFFFIDKCCYSQVNVLEDVKKFGPC